MKNLKQNLIEKAMGNVENTVPDIFGDVVHFIGNNEDNLLIDHSKIPVDDSKSNVVWPKPTLEFDANAKFLKTKKPAKSKKVTVYAPAAVATHHEQVIYGNVPSKSNCYKIITLKSKEGKTFSSLGKTPALKDYEKQFYIQCSKYRNANIDGFFEFKMDVYYPNQRPDLDNSLKVTLDCLQSVNAIKNDRNCIDIHVRKFLDPKNPRIEFTIKSVQHAD